MNLKTRFVLHPGFVTSIKDGDRHYISCIKLMDLCGLNQKRHDVVIFDRSFKPGEHDVHVYPRASGKYKNLGKIFDEI